MNVISVRQVSKQFRGNQIFEGLSFDIEEGKTYALVGPNGSGKSVLLKLICGFETPDEGEIIIDPRYLNGKRTFPDSFGVTINGPAYMPNQTAVENLAELIAIRHRVGRAEIYEALDSVGLTANSKQKVRTFSQGMKQKLSLAQALIENPNVLILDEPFNALDADSVERLKRLLLNLKTQAKTIVFTSHSQAEVHDLSDYVFAISNHKVQQLESDE